VLEDALDHYLTRFAERGTNASHADNNTSALTTQAFQKAIDSTRGGRWRWVLIVPAFAEDSRYFEALLDNIHFPADARQSLLLINVINCPDDATSAQRGATMAAVQAHTSSNKEILAHITPGIDMLTIDAASDPLPANQATGLARKLGNDIACELLLLGRVKSPVLCNTDADAVLPGDYFQRLANADSTTRREPGMAQSGAWVLPFSHVGHSAELQHAGQLYELYLRSLYLNLERCGSPYAYPSLGSVLAINPELYAKCRGFPKRRAGEDFYLLNKLAKVSDVHYLAGSPVRLAARTSDRVPFGTGPALRKALTLTAANYRGYSPTSYVLLRQFHDGVRHLRVNRKGRKAVLPKAWQDPDLHWLLKGLGLPATLLRLQQNHTTKRGLQRAVLEWFDALKTVRFLNAARHFNPDPPLLDTLQPLLENPLPIAELSGKFPHDPRDPTALNIELEHSREPSRHSIAHQLEKFT